MYWEEEIEQIHHHYFRTIMGYVGATFFNYVGGTVRFLLGSIYFKVLGKPNFSYEEYIHGPKNSDHFYDTTGHRFVNIILGFITVVSIAILTRHIPV